MIKGSEFPPCVYMYVCVYIATRRASHFDEDCTACSESDDKCLKTIPGHVIVILIGRRKTTGNSGTKSANNLRNVVRAHFQHENPFEIEIKKYTVRFVENLPKNIHNNTYDRYIENVRT